MNPTHTATMPPQAEVHFGHVWARADANARQELAERVRDFDRRESSQGGGAGYAARLGMLLVQELRSRTQALRAALLEVHADFEAPLHLGVEDTIADWGARALSSTYQGLEGYFIRHLGHRGLGANFSSGLDSEYTLSRAAIANDVRQHIWTLRNVPMKKPQAPALVVSSVNITGPVGAVFTGPGASGTITQNWSNADTGSLKTALERLGTAIEASTEVDRADKAHLTTSLEAALKELAEPAPGATRLRITLGGLGSAVQALASVKPAWELVRDAMTGMGM